MDYLWIKWKEKGRKLEQLINKIMIIDMNTISRTTASRSGKLIHIPQTINKQPRWKWAKIEHMTLSTMFIMAQPNKI